MSRRVAIPNRNRKIMEYDLKAAETFIDGAIVLLDANEDILEASADPTSILGVSVSPAAGETGFAQGGARQFDTTKVLVAIAEPGRTFLMEGDNDPVKADINQAYGVVKGADNVWRVDGTETVATVVRVDQIDLDRNLYEVTFLQAVMQANV